MRDKSWLVHLAVGVGITLYGFFNLLDGLGLLPESAAFAETPVFHTVQVLFGLFASAVGLWIAVGGGRFRLWGKEDPDAEDEG
jgi:hypothetical protein